jgi:hypothetical protein
VTKPISTLISVITLAILAFGLLAPAAQAESAGRTALIVVHGDGHMISKCIAFDETEISSYDALQRSGLSVRFSGYGGLGAAVCAIDGEGCPREDQQCFCQCLGTPCLYWTFWLWRDGHWAFAQRGASNVPVHDGDLQAWFWSDGQEPPPAVLFEQVCPPPPTETPLPTSTPVPTDTPRPTETMAPNATPVPMPVPTDTAVPPPLPTDTVLPTESPSDTPVPTLEATATALPMRTAAPTVTPARTATRTPVTAIELASPTVQPTSPPTGAQAATATSTASPMPKPISTATPLSSPTATPPTSGTPAPAQYGAFALLAAVLLGAFWILRRKQGIR